MDPLQFVFAIHNHQPVGNFDTVFEEAYQHAYRPFLGVLQRHPRVKSTQHWSGILLAWLEQHHPECITQIGELVARGQVELLTGAYYEAILAVIPEEDRIGQIRKLTGTIQRLFGVTPRGMWLAERVWEPHLVSSLVRADVEFVMLDDLHFRHAGLPADRLFGYYMTEELGYQLKVLPMDKTLRYTIPFRELVETTAHLGALAAAHPGGMVVHADDGEKFGVWPRTYKHVYEEGWLDRFCSALEDPALPVRMVHGGEVIDAMPPSGIVYLPTDSYVEMTLWSLPAHDQVSFESFERKAMASGILEGHEHHLRGGFWRNFLAKYPEGNHMQKKMLRIARRLHAAEREHKIPADVREHLWAAQCNDPYWHGLFGGLYLPALRFNMYRHLIQAEAGLDALQRFNDTVLEEGDFDADGAEELVVESRVSDFCFKPSLGGSVVEWSYKPGAVNVLDVLSRREEGSHRKLAAAGLEGAGGSGWESLLAREPDLLSHLVFDWYRHASFLDHILAPETTLAGMARASYGELGDFVNQPYRCEILTEEGALRIALTREGGVWRDGQRHGLRITKVYTIDDGGAGLTVAYELENMEPVPLAIRFGIEFVAGGMAGNAPDRYYLIEGERIPGAILQSRGAAEHVTRFGVRDEWMAVTVEYAVDRPAGLWRFPLETISLSEGGFERLYQGSVMVPHWDVALSPQGSGEGSRWTLGVKARAVHA